jgi:hypothetical protein
LRTAEGWLTLEIDRAVEATGQTTDWRWPNPKYRSDPCGFFEEVLGLPVWGTHEAGQRAMLENIRDHDRVAVRAGRKVSKSYSLGGIALWWFTCWYDAQVIITSTTARQVDDVNWGDVKFLHDRSLRPLDPQGDTDAKLLEYNPRLTTRPIDGEPRILARSGLVSGFRKVAGFTAREGVAAQGKSGVHQLYLLDESSGIPQAIIEAIIGNMAGGGKLVMWGNPTKSEDEFYEAFGKKQRTAENPTGYKTLTISSEESPNVVAGKLVIPGLALRSYIEEREREWGRESALFKVHVLGQHVELEEGKIISLHDIHEATERWAATGERFVGGDGVLHLGVDPALSKAGDEAVFVARRGKRVVEIRADRNLTEDGHVAVAIDMIRTHGTPGELAVINLDSLGDVGERVKNAFLGHQQRNPALKLFVLCCIRASDNALREPVGYYHVYDELWAIAAEWIHGGGAIPEDPKLERDLHAPAWKFDKHQRAMATRKDDLRRILNRSPDRGNALCLACWENTRLVQQAQEQDQQQRHAPKQSAIDEPRAAGMDPYAGMDAWR